MCVLKICVCVFQLSDYLRKSDSYLWEFRSLQLSLLLCAFVAVVGGGFFLATALFIETDRQRAENYIPAGEEEPRFGCPSGDKQEHRIGSGKTLTQTPTSIKA